MALVIEDGSGVAGANSYISVVDAQAYATARGLAVVITEASLIRACDYLESLRAEYQGTKTDEDQALQWPRYGAYLDGASIDSDEIPDVLPKAQAQLACDILAGTDIMPTGDGREVLSEAVQGAVSVTYAQTGAGIAQPALTAARALIDPLLSTTGAMTFSTVRV